MKQIIEKRIGLEMFSDKLSQVSKHEFYSRSAKQPQLSCKQPSEVLFDYVFTKLFKTLESKYILIFIHVTFVLEITPHQFLNKLL